MTRLINPGEGSLMLELIPCIYPECKHSGREIQNICFKGVQFNHVSLHPKEGWVMSVSDPTTNKMLVTPVCDDGERANGS